MQVPNMSKYISRNKGATIKTFRETAHDKVILGKKKHFCSPKMAAPSKKNYSPKSVYCNQCF